MKILCIEDDPFWWDDLNETLKRAGHEAVWAENLSSAELELANKTFDGIICDGNVDQEGSGDGLQLAAQLHAEGKNVVIFTPKEKSLPSGIPAVHKWNILDVEKSITEVLKLLEVHVAR